MRGPRSRVLPRALSILECESCASQLRAPDTRASRVRKKHFTFSVAAPAPAARVSQRTRLSYTDRLRGVSQLRGTPFTDSIDRSIWKSRFPDRRTDFIGISSGHYFQISVDDRVCESRVKLKLIRQRLSVHVKVICIDTRERSGYLYCNISWTRSNRSIAHRFVTQNERPASGIVINARRQSPPPARHD